MSTVETFTQGIDTIIGEDQLRERLGAGKRLKVKLGVDPTRPDLTFGHMVVFNKLRQFQEAGHEAILIIGDYTTRVGDPSGRSDERPVLSREEIEANASTYLDQAFKILDSARTTVVRNSDWFDGQSFMDCLLLARKMTVARMLERDDFSKRHQAGSPISIIEFLYPLLQGHDSVQVRADVELGGTDQLFNLLVGRQLQKDAGQLEQICITMPLLIGLDGTRKMSKSADNYIAFNDAPREMFGKIMSIPDAVMWDYYRLLLLYPDDAVEELKSGHPMDAKKFLASTLVARFHGGAAGMRERDQFEQVFSKNQLPDEMPAFSRRELAEGDAPLNLIDATAATGLFESKGEIRRLFKGGAIKLDQQRVDDPFTPIPTPPPEGIVVQAGKRKFFRITP